VTTIAASPSISPVRAKGLWISQTMALSKRSVLAMIRQPALVIRR